MADGKTDEDLSRLCPICIETFKTPRSTPCKHSFCEQCLFMYVSTLKDKGELGTSFPCPVCRQDVAAPTDGNVSLSWIQTFPVNEGLVDMISEIPEGKENDTPIIMCDPCAADDEQNRAVKFCIDCQENLCKGCVDVHRKYKTLKSHTLVEGNKRGHTSQIKCISVDIKCTKHTDRYVEVYCTNHDVYCCFRCVTIGHRECPGIQEIKDMERGANQMMKRLKQNHELIKKHLELLRVGHGQSLTKLSDKLDNVETSFNQRKEDILRIQDDLQNDLNLKKKQLTISAEKKVELTMAQIERTKQRCHQNIDKIDTMMNYGLPVHKVVMKKVLADEYIRIEKEIGSGQMHVEELDVEWHALPKLDEIHRQLLACKEDAFTLVGKPSDVIRMGSILNQLNDKQFAKTGEHTVRLWTNCGHVYTGLTITEKQQLVLCDFSVKRECGRVCIYDPDNKSVSKLKMNSPFGMTVLKFNPSNIAVSVPVDKQIHIVEIKDDTLAIVRTFKTDKTPASLIGLDNGQLGVTSASPTSFDIVDVSGSEMKILKSYTQDSTGRMFKSFEYVAVDELRSHIIQPCSSEDTVFCFDFSGNPVFEYRDAKLKAPRGVDIDRNGNVYICSYGTRSIHILTASGRKVKVIKAGVPSFPRSICFDETREGFWVTNFSKGHTDKVMLFSCQE